uniref:C-type lectin domain-containing protein n=1 Tax=Laticauda laticaudata TaxID=8630 RepID=A0A8C5WZS8_LATLA
MIGISNAHQCKQNENKTNSQLQKLPCLRQYLCEPTNTPTENGSCSVCPLTWLQHKDKCYWISTSIQSWKQSYKDCVAKASQLLMISDTAEQEFIQNKINMNAWIGLEFKLPEKKWMWINGSLSNHIPRQDSRANCGIIERRESPLICAVQRITGFVRNCL